ncbi:MAG: tetratricopeptide repeat protein [Polyangiaceae bacterium]
MQPSSQVPADPAAAEVSAGLAARDPAQAVLHFEKALELRPGHYGATFQLARALDRAGRKDDATRQWQKVLALAEQSKDLPLIEMAHKRIDQGAVGDPMALGLEALYQKKDPAAAIARFREVLARNPEHYGATYQLATALDQTGDLATSRALWEKMARMADAAGDPKTAETARARLAEIEKALGPAPAADPDAEGMRAAMELLYTKRDAAAAAAELRKILARNPEHYGATYQLAAALDEAGKPSEARPLWEKALRMAEAAKDEKTAVAARARLAKKP